ncbi:hypothetical protein LCGC14_3069520 [marine sediment metagenome]|uniref:Uncharacterized protein n=1 Tax=marine sediment metagenome TaxID=412755 RepID=A0A0F8WH67_9ZZZZ
MTQRSKLFEFVILLHNESTSGTSTHLLLSPPIQAVVAATEAEARIQAARRIPDEFADRLGEVEILIRPFV